MRLSAFETFSLYLALKNHFTVKSYDYFKYDGKLKLTHDSFMVRKDRFHFQRLCRKCDSAQMKDYILSNLIKGRMWVGEMLEDEAEQNFKEYTKRKQAFTYNFNNELDKLFADATNASDVFTVKSNQYPVILNRYLSGELSAEVFSVLNHLVQFSDKFDERIGKDDVIWSKVRVLLIKLHPFLEYDKKKVKDAFKSKLYSIDMERVSC